MERLTCHLVFLVLFLAVAHHVLEEVGACVHHLHVQTGQLLHEGLPYRPEGTERSAHRHTQTHSCRQATKSAETSFF